MLGSPFFIAFYLKTPVLGFPVCCSSNIRSQKEGLYREREENVALDYRLTPSGRILMHGFEGG